MWTKAHALAQLNPDTAACHVHAEFKSPIYLPSQSALQTIESDNGTRFEVRDSTGERVHMRGLLNNNSH